MNTVCDKNCVHKGVCKLEEGLQRLSRRFDQVFSEFDSGESGNFVINIECKKFYETVVYRKATSEKVLESQASPLGSDTGYFNRHAPTISS